MRKLMEEESTFVYRITEKSRMVRGICMEQMEDGFGEALLRAAQAVTGSPVTATGYKEVPDKVSAVKQR